jgi:predicted nucleic acid-binding protein
MYLLDTTVLSEVMRPLPSANVLAWLDEQVPDQVWICAISRAEIALGIALLPEGQRKRGLQQSARAMFAEEFAGRSLAFDDRAADCYAEILAHRRRRGRPISVEDAQIASIAVASGLRVATRNTADFIGIPHLEVVDPWATKAN